MKNHVVTLAEIAIEYKIRLADQVDARKGKKALIAVVVPGKANVFQVFSQNHLIFASNDIYLAVIAYNEVIL